MVQIVEDNGPFFSQVGLQTFDDYLYYGWRSLCRDIISTTNCQNCCLFSTPLSLICNLAKILMNQADTTDSKPLFAPVGDKECGMASTKAVIYVTLKPKLRSILVRPTVPTVPGVTFRDDGASLYT